LLEHKAQKYFSAVPILTPFNKNNPHFLRVILQVAGVGRDWNQLVQDIKEIWEFAREVKELSAA